MKTERNASQVPAVKDGKSERPIPTAWRPVITEIVSAFVKQDYQLTNGVSSVAPVPAETAEGIANYIQSYGAELIELPEETWASSVCIWMGNRWEALIDLWSRSEGRSDLVLSLNVSEASDGFKFTIYMVYVP